jgi:hypothetical protein
VTLAESLIWVLRLAGVAYLVGGVWMARQMWFWARMGPTMDAFYAAAESLQAEHEGRAPAQLEKDDVARSWWLFGGALMTALAGAAMLLGHRLAPLILSLLIAQQLLYFIRQRRRELRAATPDDAAEARPNRATIHGFYGALGLAVLAAWLGWKGALWG